jgi:hypothetical protein
MYRPLICNKLNKKCVTTKCRLCSASRGWVINARKCRRSLFLINWIKKCIALVLLYRCTVMHGQQNIKIVRVVTVLWWLWYLTVQMTLLHSLGASTRLWLL